MNITRLCMISILALLLMSCSRIKFAYNQLDWLIPYYLRSYMDLTEQQNVYLDDRVEELLEWHCSNQLPGYARLFRSANLRFQTGKTTREDLENYSDQFERYWEGLVIQVIPAISHLMVTSNEEQISELFKNLEEKNREWLEEFTSQTAEERTAEYQERVGEELERWFGPLNNGQRHVLRKWAVKFKPLGIEGLEMRKNWQRRLHRLFYYRKNPSAISAGLKELFLRPEQFRPASYQNLLDENKKVTIELIYQVGKQLSPSQREHLSGEVISVATDFEELSCKTKKIPGRLTASTN